MLAYLKSIYSPSLCFRMAKVFLLFAFKSSFQLFIQPSCKLVCPSGFCASPWHWVITVNFSPPLREMRILALSSGYQSKTNKGKLIEFNKPCIDLNLEFSKVDRPKIGAILSNFNKWYNRKLRSTVVILHNEHSFNVTKMSRFSKWEWCSL